MIIKTVDFVKSSKISSECPPPDRTEFAFIGRSNVGKSSLINALTNRKKLAKVSSVPGKTQLINHFLINETWYLVDLPGYGWAKVSESVREEWESHINTYLVERTNLTCVFVLVDIRHEAQKKDLVFLDWAVNNDIPFCIVFTKLDKLSTTKGEAMLEKYKKVLIDKYSDMPDYFVTSAETKAGTEDILKYIDVLNKEELNNQ